VTERVYPRLGHFTILAGFVPVVGSFLSPLRDLGAFVSRTRPGAQQGASAPVAAVAP
jgi:hypothetical protein